MSDSHFQRALLQRRIDRLLEPRKPTSGHAMLGHEDIDRLLGGGLLRSRLHEILALSTDDAASAAGFTAICAQRFGKELAWVQLEGGDRALYPQGLNEIGVDPARCLFVTAPDPLSLLRAADEAMRCSALQAVVIEVWGKPQLIDLTVSRRLLLAAEQSGVTALLLRIAVEPVPSAAHTRWAVAAAPSRPLAAAAPGGPALDLELLRQRGGHAGRRWRVEWNRDEACFRTAVHGDLAAVPGSGSLDDRDVLFAVG